MNRITRIVVLTAALLVSLGAMSASAGSAVTSWTTIWAIAASTTTIAATTAVSRVRPRIDGSEEVIGCRIGDREREELAVVGPAAAHPVEERLGMLAGVRGGHRGPSLRLGVAALHHHPVEVVVAVGTQQHVLGAKLDGFHAAIVADDARSGNAICCAA